MISSLVCWGKLGIEDLRIDLLVGMLADHLYLITCLL